MKKILAMILAFAVLMTNMYLGAWAGEAKSNFFIEYDQKVYQYTARTVSINIDGIPVETGEMPAIILNSLTLVPAREVFESDAFDAKVEWNGAKSEVYITYKDKFIVLKINSNIAYVNNVPITMDMPAKLIRDTSKKNAKTMIPLRFVSENLGFKVDWDGSSYTAVVTSQASTDITEVPTDEEQLDQLTSEGAKHTLPTALKSAPVLWSSVTNPGEVVLPNSTEITEQSNPLVNISEVKYVEENGQRYFKIVASGPITYAKTSIWDGKYIVDIHNAHYALDEESTTYKQTYNNNPMAVSVRGSQQSMDSMGREVTRVVFDLKYLDRTYNFSVSPDRKNLMIEMSEDKITGIELGQTSEGDYLLITGTSKPDVEEFRLSNPNRIVFDIPNFNSLLGYKEAGNVGGQYIKTIRTAQFDPTTARVVVETDGQADYTIEKYSDNQTIIRFVEPSYDNIVYENTNNPVITLENSANAITIDGITYEDRYYDREYIIHLPGNYESIFGAGGIQIMDDVFESILIQTNANGNTDLIIKEKEIYEFRIESDANNVYIKAYKPKELYSQVLVVDFGHGGTDPGAISPDGSVYEKNLNLAIGLKLKALLDANPSIKVYYTRRDDTFISLQERVDIANEVDADFFVSVHNNSFTSVHNGTETIFFKDQDQPGLNSVELARIVHAKVVSAIGLKDRGVKDNNYLFVLRNTNMPAIIVEVGFVSSAVDLPIITQDDTQNKVAQAIYEGILQTFTQYPTGR